MNFLILINNAPKMVPYHYHLGEMFKSKGHNVYYAISDDFFRFNYKNITLDSCNTYIFSEYFKSNYNNTKIESIYKSINVWETFFPDYDRNHIHIGIQPKKNEYYEHLFPNLINYFDYIYKEHKINYVVYENISNSFAYFAFNVGKLNNVKYFGYLPSRMPERFEIQTEVYNIVEQFEREYICTNFDCESDDVKGWVDSYLNKYKNIIPSYHTKNHPLNYNYSLSKLYFNREKIRLFFASIKYAIIKRHDLKYSYQLNNPLKLIYCLFTRQIKRRIKTIMIRKKFDNVDYSDSYFIFPIQFKPESSTSVWSKNFTDDLSVIINICSSLPQGTILYVKEHFVNLGLPSMLFYNELVKIPNLKLIHPDEKNTPLIKNSLGVITLTSTMGFEALMMGKSVVALGDIFYQCHPNCYKMNSFKDLYQILISIMQNIDIDPLSDINKKFITAYYKITYFGNTDFVSYQTFNNDRFCNPVVEAIFKNIK